MIVFDPATLRQLVDDTQSPRFVLDLAHTFRSMLQPRVDRVVDAILADDLDDAMDAVLSLKVSSTMTGVLETAGLAAGVETRLRAGEVAAARSQALLLLPAATRAEVALDAFLAAEAQEPSDSIR